MSIKVAWITNLPAPYRNKVWENLGKTFDFHVFFTLKENNYKGWKLISAKGFSSQHLGKKSIRLGELDVILGTNGAKKIVSEAQVVIVSGWESFFYIKSLRSAKKLRIPTLLFYESTLSSHRFNGYFVRRFRSWVFSLADYIVTSGTASTEAVIEMGVPPEKISTLFNPVDVDWFSTFAAENRVENLSGHRFLYVGQLIDRKNVKTLIESFSKISKSEDRLTIVGEGPLAGELINYVNTLGLGDSICFTGHQNQEQLAMEYSKANTLVLPSTNEVWGLVVNEALACGLHVVVSKSAGVSDFVAPMKGSFITGTTVDELAEGLKKSREQWIGPILEPEILKFTPEVFALEISSLIEKTYSRSNTTSLTWLTNIPAPYRIPIWEEINSRLNLELLFLRRSEKGRHWDLAKQLTNLKFNYVGLQPIYIFKNTPIYLNWYKVWKKLKRGVPDNIYVDGYESPAFFITAFLAKRKGACIIFGYRSTLSSHRFNGYFVRRFRSWVFSLADYIVTSGTASTEAVIEMGVPPEKISTLFNPVDVDWFSTFAAENRVENLSGHRFLYVGQLIDRKNVKTLIESFSKISKSEDRLTIVGEGPLAGELINYVNTLGLGDSICFTGHQNQEQLAMEYSKANTLVLPSTNEVWGLVVNEALACGLHVVVSKSAGVSDFVAPMKGSFITGTTVDELAEGLKKSREQWIGPILEPEILKFTPEVFALEISSLIEKTYSRSNTTSS